MVESISREQWKTWFGRTSCLMGSKSYSLLEERRDRAGTGMVRAVSFEAIARDGSRENLLEPELLRNSSSDMLYAKSGLSTNCMRV